MHPYSVDLDHYEPLCVVCHRRRDYRGSLDRQPLKDQCVKGHPYDDANTYWKPSGQRECRECARLYQRERRRRSSVAQDGER